jgi:hypothetical protein
MLSLLLRRLSRRRSGVHYKSGEKGTSRQRDEKDKRRNTLDGLFVHEIIPIQILLVEPGYKSM